MPRLDSEFRTPSSAFLPTRRELLHSATFGIGTVALAHLLNREGLLAAPSKPELEPRSFDLKPKPPHHAPRAKAMISLFMQGGPSAMETFDPKPELDRLNGKPCTATFKFDSVAQASTTALGSKWKFAKHGKSGLEVSELLPHMAGVADDLCVVRSMHTDVNNHVASTFALSSGRITAGHPVLGSWVCYGLGAESQDLPAFMALPDPASLPVGGVDHWANGWLPSIYQGTVIRAREPRILNLDPPPHLRGEPQEKLLKYLEQMNREHLTPRPGESDLEARIATYSLAARMQTAAKEALDISSETKQTKTMYGMDNPETAEYGSRCLIARRLVERGVRFVQVFTSNQFWDHHLEIQTRLPVSCKKVDQGSAALIKDLKQRGLLDSTLVTWGGEMGRLPVIQSAAGGKIGRDHNTYGFTWCFAGGGTKAGHVHGATDEFGHKAVQDTVSHHDLHATLLHLFGLDATKLVYKRNGLEQTILDGQAGRVVKEILS